MYCVKKMTEDLYWVGASERRLNLFENAYPLTNGVSYNSYLLLDEKTVLIDTVDKSVSGLYFENVEHVLSGRKLDYLIQEVNRECNTIGSKCNDLTIARDVVNMKAEVEKIREQVQNIE